MKQPHVFISYAGEDYNYLYDVRSASSNPNNLITFVDRSLAEAIRNDFGHINRRPPSDPVSEPVKREIKPLLQQAGKLLVLVGANTHSHEWVLWEIETFLQMHRDRSRILFMRVPEDPTSGMPGVVSSYDIHDWNTSTIAAWLQR